MKKVSRIGGALLLGTAAAFLIGEGALRFVGWANRRFLVEARATTWMASTFFTDSSAFKTIRRFHSIRAFGNTPGVTFPGLRINTQGFRGPEIQTPKPAGTFRVACLGDSCTFGWSVKDNETYPAQLQTRLERSLGQPVDVVNAGSPGYSSWQALSWCRENVFDLDPDVLVLYLGWNDLFEARPEGTVRQTEKTIRYLLTKSLFLTKLRWAGIRLQEFLHRPDPAAEAALFRNHDPRFFRDQMARIIREAKEKNIRVLLLTLPTPRTIGAPPIGGPAALNPSKFESLYTRYNDAILRLAREESIEVIDLRADMNGRKELFNDLCHPNTTGNSLIVERLAEVLLAGRTPS